MSQDEVIEKILNISSFIEYLERTGDDEWVCDIVRTKGGDKNCVKRREAIRTVSWGT